MKKRKMLLPILLTISALGLSGCSLFDDSDIAIYNHYNPQDETPEVDPNIPVAGGISAKTVSGLENIYCFKNIAYGEANKIINTYKDGGENHLTYNVNSGNDYDVDEINNFDLYVPNNLDKNGKNVVILFIHGGAWVSGLKTDVNPYVHAFAKKGYITATIKYTLLSRDMNDASLSIFRDLDEIDACIKTMKDVLSDDLGFDTSKCNLVIGGASSGAHLSMLYAYSRGHNSPLNLKFVVDAVGPVDIKEDGWKSFIDASDTILNNGIDKTAIANQSSNLTALHVSGEDYNWTPYQTMRIANGMCGLPYSLSEVEASTDENKINITNPNAASNSMLAENGGEDQLSVTYWMKKNNSVNKYPVVCAYAGNDTIVGVAQYARLQTTMDELGIEYDYTYFKDSEHNEISEKKNSAKYHEFINNIENRIKAI